MWINPGTWPRVSRWSRVRTRLTAARLAAVLLVITLVTGCAWRQAERQADFDTHYGAGDYDLAAMIAARYAGEGYEPRDVNSLLWTLQQATALQAQGRHGESIELFDTTEAFFRLYDLEGQFSQWLSEAGALLTNDATQPYRGTVYDAIMVNTYKALGFMAEGDMDNARIELNRARDRQRRAVEVFSEQIRAEQQALEERQADNRLADYSGAMDSAHDRLTPEYERLAQWSIYPDYVNPLASWLEGLFLMTQAQAPGDFNRASDVLERVVGMVPENHWAWADYHWAEDLADGRRRHRDLPPTTWVLYESGQGPIKVEQQIQLPIGFRYDGTHTIYTGFAYPVLRYRSGAGPALQLRSEDDVPRRVQPLSNMDAVISTEFSQQLPRIVTRAVAASVARTAIQYQLQRQFGDFAGFLGLIYQLYSTQADTRIWSSLPKQFDVLRLEHEPGGSVTLDWAGQARDIELPDSRFVLIWVRQPTTSATPMIEVIPLSGQ